MPLGAASTEVPVDPAAAEVAALARRARQGDAGAYERLYRLHVARVYALCLRLAGDSGRAREVAQDVFVQAWRKLEHLRADEAFSSWLYRIPLNVSLMAIRQRARIWSRESGSDELEAIAPVRGASSEHVGVRIDLERAIALLPDQARAVLVLHDIEGYGHQEIAAQMQIAVGTSKAHLHRARRRLREVLGR